MFANRDSNITMALVIEGGVDVVSSPLTVKFDPNVLRLTDVGRGDFFSSGGQVPVFTKNIQQQTGTATVNLSRLPGTAGASGSGVLVSLTFQAASPGSAVVSIPNLTIRNSQGQVVYNGSPQINVSVK